MAVRIRLSRVGATKRPSYRVVAIDSRRPRDGRALEILGYYDPLTEPATVQIDAERFAAWVGKGALPSDTVAKLIKLNGSVPGPAPIKADAPRPKAARARKPSARATARGAAAAATETGAETPPDATAVAPPAETPPEATADATVEATLDEKPAETPPESTGEVAE